MTGPPLRSLRAQHYREQAIIARERAMDVRFEGVRHQYEKVAEQYDALADNVEMMEARWSGRPLSR
jgi:hypothetical protein